MDGPLRAGFARLEASLQDLRRELDGAPRAALVVSGHWESETFAVSSAARPGMVYDYYGFPKHTYSIVYPAPGSPELAARAQALLEGGGLACRSDPDQGFDHGTFSMMKVLYPDADLPIVQLAIRGDLDPAAHIEAGRRLAPLRDQGVLILGSGSSFHNLGERGPAARPPSKAFDAWLQDSLERAQPAERLARLQDWRRAPEARNAHPREDHLIPLMVAVGAAESEPAALIYHEDDVLGGWTLSSFRFGASVTARA
jgi:aromatic ring-opening dioxygenase catalytic subunit (LigB family)